MVIDDDDVEGESGFLTEGRTDGVLDGTYAVADGNDDRGLDGHGFAVEDNLVVLASGHVGIDVAQVACDGPLHLHLAGTVAWVYIVELLLSAQAGVGLHLGVQVFADMEGQLVEREEQAQVVEPSMVIGVHHLLLEVLLQPLRTDEQHAAHGKVVAHGAQLVVNERTALLPAVGQQGVVVGIDERGSAVVGDGHQASQGLIAQLQGPCLRIDEGVLRLCQVGHLLQYASAERRLFQPVYFVHVRVLPQLRQSFPGLFLRFVRNEAVNAGSFHTFLWFCIQTYKIIATWSDY